MNVPRRERGLALITAMLVVAIAATVAAYVSLDQQVWLRQAQNLSDRAQAEVVRAAAEEWAITILDKDAQKNSGSDNLTEDWAKPLPPIPVEGGLVTGQITDAQGLFNLNNLVRNNAPSPTDIGIFQHLLQSLNIDPNLSDAVIDWIDSNSDTQPYGAEDTEYLQLPTPYRAANQPMQSVEELRLVRGFTPEIVAKLRPYVTALPQPTGINVNTAPAQVLSALFYTLPSSTIDQLIAGRPYTDPSQLVQKLQQLTAGTNTNLPPANYGINSSYFMVHVDTQFGRYRGTSEALIQRAPGGAPGSGTHVLWHSQRLPAEVAAALAKTTKNPDTSPAGNM